MHVVKILYEIDRFITAPHCINSWADNDSDSSHVTVPIWIPEIAFDDK